MDPLSSVLSMLKPSGYGVRELDAGGDWSLSFPASRSVRCYAIQAGECWLAIDDVSAPRRLGGGDVVLLSGSAPYRLQGGAPVPPIDAFDFFPTVPADRPPC